jgi:hypothetical protein
MRTDGRTETDRETDRQTDMTKLIVGFCNFANAPKTPTFPSLLTPTTICRDSIHISHLTYHVTRVIKRQLSAATKRVAKHHMLP